MVNKLRITLLLGFLSTLCLVVLAQGPQPPPPPPGPADPPAPPSPPAPQEVVVTVIEIDDDYEEDDDYDEMSTQDMIDTLTVEKDELQLECQALQLKIDSLIASGLAVDTDLQTQLAECNESVEEIQEDLDELNEESVLETLLGM